LIDSTEIQPHHLLVWADVGTSNRGVKNVLPRKNIVELEIPCEGKGARLKDIVAEVEKEIIMRVLEKYPSSRLAGQVLGVSNTTVLNKMRSYGL
jgi:transcriptional regulator of aroF, aroG, tyrA and aromatic amino acid transport